MSELEDEELLENANERFPLESFLVMRRAGISVQEALHALDYQETDLRFLDRAVLELDPHDQEAISRLNAPGSARDP